MFSWPKKGSATIVINDEKIILDENSLVIINPNEVHFSISNDFSEDYYVIYIDRNWYKNLQSITYKTNEIFLLPNKIENSLLIESFFTLFDF